ncbi:MAG: hypothetical protein QM790_06165 [Nibricoccus sp.]
MKRLLRFSLLALVLVGPWSLQGAIEKDLGQSLSYLRITDAETDKAEMVQAIAQKKALIIDLRCLTADRDFANALRTALSRTPQPHAARIFLLNTSTSGPLRAIFSDERLSSIITIGPRSLAVRADIEVSISEEEDRKAFAELTNGTPIEKLIADGRDKRRYDEAKLVQDHANGVTPAESDLPGDADDTGSISDSGPADLQKTAPADKKTEPAPLLDSVLARAVQLHRTLVALKKT